MRKFWVLALAAFGAAAATCAQARAADVDFYQGKTIRLIVSSGAGGGYDLYSRIVAKRLAADLPGKPNVVVENMPGAGGLAAANYLANVAPQDGTVVAQIQNTAPFETLFGVAGAKFDPLKLRFLGSANSEVAVAFTWRTSKTKTFADLLKRQTIMAGSSGAISDIDARAMNELLGTKIKLVTGYRGASDSLLAIERGEAEGFPAIFWSTLKADKQDWLAQRKINLLVQLALAKDPDLPNTPLIFDFTKTASQRAVFQLLLTPQAIGRPFVVGPGVPAARLALLRKAFAEALRDPELLAEAKKSHLEIQPMSGPQAERLLAAAYRAPAAVVARVRALLKGAH